MKNVLKTLWDGMLTLMAYALCVIVMSVVIAIAPAVCIITALAAEIKLSEAFEQFMHDVAKAFYEGFEK